MKKLILEMIMRKNEKNSDLSIEKIASWIMASAIVIGAFI